MGEGPCINFHLLRPKGGGNTSARRVTATYNLTRPERKDPELPPYLSPACLQYATMAACCTTRFTNSARSTPAYPARLIPEALQDNPEPEVNQPNQQSWPTRGESSNHRRPARSQSWLCSSHCVLAPLDGRSHWLRSQALALSVPPRGVAVSRFRAGGCCCDVTALSSVGAASEPIRGSAGAARWFHHRLSSPKAAPVE